MFSFHCRSFSGIAYYYARALYKEVQIPIGIINASWGGTDIETWISDEAFTALPSNVQKQYNMEVVNNLEEYIRQNKGQKQAFLDAMEMIRELTTSGLFPDSTLWHGKK